VLKVTPWQHAFGATCSGFGAKTKVRFWTQARADRDSTHSLKKEITFNYFHLKVNPYWQISETVSLENSSIKKS